MNDTDSGVQLELTTALRQEFFKHQKLDKTTRGNPKNTLKHSINLRMLFKKA